MSSLKKELRYHITAHGSSPAEDWLEDLRDRKGAAIIRTRLDRLAYGNPGDCKALGQGLFELRVHFGPGYRVYYGEEGRELIILVYGGDKSTQTKDIHKAKEFWAAYRSKK